MKKVICVIMMTILMIISISATAEKATTWYDARDILEEYAKENNMDWWINDHYEESIETVFSLLTLNKKSLLEEFDFDWDSHTTDEFAKFYENEWLKQMNLVVKVTVIACDYYKDNTIYEILMTSEEDLDPDDETQRITTARGLIIVY